MNRGERRKSFYVRRGKRLVDLLASTVLLILLAPVSALIAVAVLLAIGRPVLFRQLRPGLAGRPFTLTKFRTMRAQSASGPSETDAQRLTAWGRVLRATSLDELPELLSIIRGEMSLVGPRPLLMEYLELYSSEQSRRHEVLPGLTGWAQVHGRNTLTWPARLAHDVWYVDHVSLSLDLKIIAMTLGQVIRGRGISAPDHATMPRFEGDENE